MCTGRATSAPPPRVPLTHLVGCSMWLRGDPLTFDPNDCTCPRCVAQASALLDEFCDCDVLHTAGECVRNVCDGCGGRIA